MVALFIPSGELTSVIVKSVFFLLAAICVAFRFIYRFHKRDFWWDDWTILGALITDLGMFICNILSQLVLSADGEFTSQREQLLLKTYFATDTLYNPSVTLARISVLLFYKRIFSMNKRFLIFFLFLINGQCLAAILGLIFSINPVQAQWDPSVVQVQLTINADLFYRITAIINVLLDIAILAFAQAKIWHLQLNLKRKLSFSVVFLVGVLTIVSSILRVVYLGATLPFTDGYTDPSLFTSIETSLSITCACLPFVYSLLRLYIARHNAQRTTSSHAQPYKKPGSLVTFGRRPSSFRRAKPSYTNDVQLGTDGHGVIYELNVDDGTHNITPLDPVRIRTEYFVTR